MALLAYPLVVGGQGSRVGNMCRFIKLLSPTDNFTRNTGFCNGQQAKVRVLSPVVWMEVEGEGGWGEKGLERHCHCSSPHCRRLGGTRLVRPRL